MTNQPLDAARSAGGRTQSDEHYGAAPRASGGAGGCFRHTHLAPEALPRSTRHAVAHNVSGHDTIEELSEWQNRPLDAVYPVLFVDAIHVKVRDGQVTNRPFYVVIGVSVDGHRDILGIWAGDGGEGAKYWLQVLTEIKNRGVADACIVVCDGLKGLPESITTVWPQALVQACVVHLIRNTFRYASRRYWEQIGKDLRPVYTAATEAAAEARFGEFAEKWGGQYPAIAALWRAAWSEFVPFLDYDIEIRRVICSTNAIESINARYRRAVKARGHFPTEQAALKCLYLVTRSLDPTGKGRAKWAMRWKPALNGQLPARRPRAGGGR